MAGNLSGRTLVKLSEGPLDVKDASEFVGSNSCGAVSIFLGTTRGTEQLSDECVQIERSG